MEIPTQKVLLEVKGATVPFYSFSINDEDFIYFDTSMTAVPEPMINAMSGLRLIDKPKKVLIMRNHQKPMGLFPKVQERFEFEIIELEDETFQIIFRFKNAEQTVNFNDTACGG